MRLQFLLSISLLSHSVAFTVPTLTRTSCIRMSKLDEPINSSSNKKLILPSKSKQGLLSKLTTFQLSALTQLKKDERNKFNKQKLLKLGITTTAFCMTTLAKSTIAHAATPLVVHDGVISPLLATHQPGLGIVEMPGMRGLSIYEMGRLPNQGAMFFALALLVASALIRSAGNGHVKLMHFMTKYLGKVLDREDAKAAKVEEIDLGLPMQTDWDEYSHSALDPLQKKKKKKKGMGRASRWTFNGRTMLFESTKKAEVESEEEKLQKASKFFQEQKYKQHHHSVHVARTKYEQTNYLDTLAINEEEKHDMPKSYLDTLSGAKKSTWDVYKHQLEETKPFNEVDDLKYEVHTLKNLLQIEQSMYQTSNQALKLAMDAQSEEMQHTSTIEELKDFDQKLSTHEELKQFDKKARDYENTVMKDAAKLSKTAEKS